MNWLSISALPDGLKDGTPMADGRSIHAEPRLLINPWEDRQDREPHVKWAEMDSYRKGRRESARILIWEAYFLNLVLFMALDTSRCHSGNPGCFQRNTTVCLDFLVIRVLCHERQLNYALRRMMHLCCGQLRSPCNNNRLTKQ
jgi:hypothetical protein